MSAYTFDCLVCVETLQTKNLSSLLEFAARHKDCGPTGGAA